MTAAELKQKAYVTDMMSEHYLFTADEMQAFIDQACKEQLQKAATAYIQMGTIEAIRTAPKPDGL